MNVVFTGATRCVLKPFPDLRFHRRQEFSVISPQDPSSIVKVRGYRCRGYQGEPGACSGALAKFQPEAALPLAWNAALKAGSRHLAVAGVCWEYGEVDGMTAGDAPAVSPRIFGASKNARHSVLCAWLDGAGASIAWRRIFFFFSPAQRQASLVPVISRSIAAGGPGSGCYRDLSGMRALGAIQRVGIEGALHPNLNEIACGAGV